MVAAALPITDVDAYVSYPVTTLSTGPFIIPFPLPPDWEGSLKCRVGGVGGTMVTAFSFTPDSTVGAGYPSGEVTLDVGVSDTTVEFWRDIPIERESDYDQGPLDFDTFNAELTRAAMERQDTRLATERAIEDAGVSTDDAIAAAAAAAASASSASASATTATNAKNAAETAEANAETAETNAETAQAAAASSASSASSSASTATTQASAAAASASTATTQAGIATTQAGLAATAKTNAETAEANAETAQAAAESARDVAQQANAGAAWTFDSATADADPGAGEVRFNDATLTSVTQVFISETDAYGASVAALLATFDDSTSATRAYLIFRKRDAPSNFACFAITAALTDAGVYDKFTVAHVSSNGSFANGDALSLSVWRVGDQGPSGPGSGDVVGPASAAADNIATFDGTTGKLIKDSGVAVSSLAPKASPALTGNPTAPTQSAGDNSTKLATTAYTDAAVAAIIAAADAMVFKGVIDCSANPNYPAADRGWTYKVSVAGKIGGASGPNVEVGDLLLCITDSSASGNHATVGANWVITQVNVDGAVTGPASSVNNRVAVFSGTSGKVIADSGLLLSGSNTGDQTITLTGDVTGTGTGSFAATIAAGAVTFAKVASAAVASAAEFFANTASKLLSVAAAWAAAVPVVISFNATQNLDFGTFINGKITATNNFTLQTPTNLKPGQSGCIEIFQDATGSRTMNSTNATYIWVGSDGVLSTAANARDLLFYYITSDSKVYLNLVKAPT